SPWLLAPLPISLILLMGCGGLHIYRETSAPPPFAHNMDLKYLAGADPELILLNIQFEELQRIPLSDMSREEINQLMQELGFYRKETPDSPVPDAFQMAPANSLPPDVEALKSRHNKQKKGAGGSDL
uniref:Selenoprotein M n=1 Tax=Naja naja TaxID=35670 RepID=A0A8C6Y9E1_NAJNA